MIVEQIVMRSPEASPALQSRSNRWAITWPYWGAKRERYKEGVYLS